jgi:PhzF family phenazine biosynthesis protein
MKRYRFKKIDAFVSGQSSGNPAGCIYPTDASALSPEEMQQIARELAGWVSEVVYVYTEERVTSLRFFSSEREVVFCGHGTIAALYDLIINDPIRIMAPIIPIRIGNREILVRNEILSSNSVFISSPWPVFLPLSLSVDAIAAALRIAPGEISGDSRISFIDAGLRTLLVPIQSLSALLAIHPDQQYLRDFCLAGNIDIVLVFTNEVASVKNQYRTRVFVPVFGYLEDPATGSGNAALGYYLLDSGSWDGKQLTLEQGRNREQPNIIKLVSDASQKQRTVFFGGSAIVRIEGEYLLYS